MSEREPGKRNYERILDYGTAFYFNPESMLFVVGSGDNQSTFNPFKSEGFYDEMLSARRNKVPGQTDLKNTDGLIYVPFGPVIQLPFSRKILAEQVVPDENRKRELSEKVRKTMRKVYKDLNPLIKLPRDGKDSMSFVANLDRDGSFRLNTFGFCACLMPDPNSMFIRYNHDTNSPLGYFTHNIDSESQRMSLMAGAGTVAFIAKEISRG